MNNKKPLEEIEVQGYEDDGKYKLFVLLKEEDYLYLRELAEQGINESHNVNELQLEEIDKRIIERSFHTELEVDTVTIQENDYNHLINTAKEQAERTKKYRTVIRHLENAYQDMSEDETKGKDDWLGGWASAIDFIEENLDWEETDEAKTIVEENKELSDRVQELEELEQEYVDLNNDFTNLALERNRYREIITELRDFVKRGENECNIKQLIMKKTNGILEGD